MAPVDSSSFELLHSIKAFDKIPVHEYKSPRTGLTVFIAEVEGPTVHGYFAVATEAFDDDGLPHTLEHLIFLGSEQYPYKGILDLLANRCLASGTNAWTSNDHTCYTIETAGSEGFLSLLPIFMDHILYPGLTEESFTTEVHHITGNGEDAGVVYCEMQARENSGESRMFLGMSRALYPGHCGYSSETGGIMKNLRESTNNEKVQGFHKKFYRPENLKVIVMGQVDSEEIFRALAPFEDKIVAKGERGPFTRPWQGAVPPVLDSQELVIWYPCDEETNGIASVAWRGCSLITDFYTTSAFSLLLKYLCDTSVSPLQKEFVQQADPYASQVTYGNMENAETSFYIMFRNVPKEKLALIKPKLDEVLQNIVDNEDIDMKRFKTIIHHYKLEWLSVLESAPHSTIATILLQQMLYGNTKEEGSYSTYNENY